MNYWAWILGLWSFFLGVPTPTPQALPKAQVIVVSLVPTELPSYSPLPSLTLTPPVVHKLGAGPTISDDQLWEALTSYRAEQRRSKITREDALCDYARKRAKELVTRLSTLPSGGSPLDNHDGFKRDADSGYVFQETNMHEVAENLAFLPRYTTPTEVIEWGWDSSEAHRETQLSDEWTHACVVGTYPIYVGIFGRR